VEHLPASFTERLKNDLGSEYTEFIEAHTVSPPVSVRFNPAKKGTSVRCIEDVPWATDACYLETRPSFTRDPLFHAGAYYVQEASSMMIEYVIRSCGIDDFSNRKVLDLCAAPGGKSTHLLSLMNNEGLLVSNELIGSRNSSLRQNITKWGYSNVVVTQNDAESFSSLNDLFDLIIVDAPCSGEGLFRKDPVAVQHWSERGLAICENRQKDILRSVCECLAPGGILVYSTCTFNKGENDGVIDALIHDMGFRHRKVEPAFGFRATEYGLQAYPHHVKGEGFYVAAVERPDTGESSTRKGKLQSVNIPQGISVLISEPAKFTFYENSSTLYGFPKMLAAHFELLKGHLNIRQAGLKIGEFKGRDFVPSAQIALSNDIHPDTPFMDVDEFLALSFLRLEPFKADLLPGWHLIRYKGLGLGWVKSLGHRINNYYPRNWRILNA
jgi:16S rRNA C967 or C1407 C5-methylase (RsmB/RsmF family)/NOL1/NOP2/fmu family ribosome biogenesis protein